MDRASGDRFDAPQISRDAHIDEAEEDVDRRNDEGAQQDQLGVEDEADCDDNAEDRGQFEGGEEDLDGDYKARQPWTSLALLGRNSPDRSMVEVSCH